MMNNMEQYEKIRTVGKGAFGVAVLYRKLKTNQLVVLKEIHTNDLSPTERQLAQNEVEVLAVLNHPNIIAYGGSFEHQGNLMIEMEYADGGTLAQMLANRERHLPERQILSLVQQICSAIEHMHSHKILHRDLKTANVFLTSEGCVKIGDFGISKVLTTNAQAQTVLGTPYYLSPEMCEGKDYNEKSDIWALGCILYEICCLHKTFQASTLPALVNKIMKAEYKPIPVGYSDKLNNLLKELFDKDPKKRPAAGDILSKKIPDILAALGDKGYTYVDPQLSYSTMKLEKSKSSMISGPFERSVLYQVKSFENNINIYPIQLPPRVKIRHMSVGTKHFVAVSDDNIVFTWGNGTKGQLGCGSTATWRHYPAILDDLLGKNIIMSSAGEEFTIFQSNNGSLYSCGGGSHGSLGHGDWNDCNTPKLIQCLSGVKVKSIRSGSLHSAALTDAGQIYTWGGGSKGQIGHNTIHNMNLPTLVVLPMSSHSNYITSIHCGGDSTMMITSQGNLFACGCNQYNKLALEEKINNNIYNAYITSLKQVTTLPGRAMNCSVGVKHCVILVKLYDDTSAVYTTGYPFHTRIVSTDNNIKCYNPERIQDLDDIDIAMLSCGPSYTVAGTVDNCILLWGTRYGVKEVEESKVNSQESSGVWSQQSFHKRGSSIEAQSDESSRTITTMLTATYLPEIITKPVSLLALYASPSQVAAGRVLILEGLFPLAHSILVLIHTSTALSKDKRHNVTNTNNDVQLEDCDSIGPIPTWMKAEIEQSQYPWSGMS